MKKILVLTDFSEIADKAAEYAVKLAAGLKASVTLFHAIAFPEKALASTDLAEEPEDNDEDAARMCLVKLDILSKKLQTTLTEETNNKPQIKFLVRAGNIKDCINRVVTDHKIDLIIMGAHLYSEFPGFLFGTNIKGVVDSAPCPILLIHEQVLFRPVRNIFYVTDFRYCDLKAMAFLKNFANGLKADISLLHACADGLPGLLDDEASAIFQDSIASNFNYKDLQYHNADGKAIQSVINQAIETKGMDILAVANKKYHFLNHLFRKNPEKDTTAYTRIPVLIIPGN